MDWIQMANDEISDAICWTQGWILGSEERGGFLDQATEDHLLEKGCVQWQKLLGNVSHFVGWFVVCCVVWIYSYALRHFKL